MEHSEDVSPAGGVPHLCRRPQLGRNTLAARPEKPVFQNRFRETGFPTQKRVSCLSILGRRKRAVFPCFWPRCFRFPFPVSAHNWNCVSETPQETVGKQKQGAEPKHPLDMRLRDVLSDLAVFLRRRSPRDLAVFLRRVQFGVSSKEDGISSVSWLLGTGNCTVSCFVSVSWCQQLSFQNPCFPPGVSLIVSCFCFPFLARFFL